MLFRREVINVCQHVAMKEKAVVIHTAQNFEYLTYIIPDMDPLTFNKQRGTIPTERFYSTVQYAQFMTFYVNLNKPNCR